MINHLDNLLRQLFVSEIDEIEESLVGFQVPNADWVNHVKTSNANALNVYLVDVRENRKLRSNHFQRSIINGIVIDESDPSRIDCHYLISSWSPSDVTPQVEATVDEHELLYKAIAVLMKKEVLIPRKIYSPDSLPSSFPEEIADDELPLEILPVQGFEKLSEFWSTLSMQWRPMAYIVVTLPVIHNVKIAGPMVTTRITEYLQSNLTETAKVYTQIGGFVKDSAGHAVSDAWVQLESDQGVAIQTTYTDSRPGREGSYTFLNLRSDKYRIRVRKQGYAETERSLMVPSPTGEYDITLS